MMRIILEGWWRRTFLRKRYIYLIDVPLHSHHFFQVNLGVLREQNMAKVHERTLNLLYRNTRVLPVQPLKPEIEKPSSDRTSYKQLSLTPGENALPTSCFSCLRPSCAVVQTCTSCQKPVGATCVAKCNACPALSCRWPELFLLVLYIWPSLLAKICM